MTRYRIPADTKVRIRRFGVTRWRPHKTRRPLDFYTYMFRNRGKCSSLVFSHAGWQIWVSARDIDYP